MDALIAWLTVADGAFLLAAVYLAVHRWVDGRRLRAFLLGLEPMPATARERILHVTAACYRLPRRAGDPVPLSRIFGPLGASVGAILREGACCSGLSRLTILSLNELGIPARQITLYHRNGEAQHCLVEASTPDGPLLVDPSYGIALLGASGEPIGADSLRRGVPPTSSPLIEDRRCGYPQNSYYDFDYRLTRTANWTNTAVRRLVYRIACAIDRRAIDDLSVPPALEWPQTLFVLVVGAILIALHLSLRFIA